MKKRIFLLLLLPAIIISGCSAISNEPAEALENYFRSLAANDAAGAISYSCAEWESSAQIDIDTFAAYPSELEGLSCREMSRTGDFAIIECSGTFLLDYNGDLQKIELSDHHYRAVVEGGEWRMCGYER